MRNTQTIATHTHKRPDCSSHSKIKMENDSFSLPAKPDTLTAADSTTVAYTLSFPFLLSEQDVYQLVR